MNQSVNKFVEDLLTVRKNMMDYFLECDDGDTVDLVSNACSLIKRATKELEKIKTTNESHRPRGRMLRETAEDDELVGKQKFTVGELKRAWKELERRIDDDEEIAEYGYRDKLDIRGYARDKQHIRNNDYRSVWADFSFEGLKNEFEDIRDTIVDADYEVYFNDLKERMADTAEHGIIIKNGKIVDVY